jgi:hypothetical protein
VSPCSRFQLLQRRSSWVCNVGRGLTTPPHRTRLSASSQVVRKTDAGSIRRARREGIHDAHAAAVNTISTGTRNASTSGSKTLPAPPFARTTRASANATAIPSMEPVATSLTVCIAKTNNVALAGADGHANRELTRSPRDRECQRPVDAGRGEQNADGNQRKQRAGPDQDLLGGDLHDLIERERVHDDVPRRRVLKLATNRLDERGWIPCRSNHDLHAADLFRFQRQRQKHFRLRPELNRIRRIIRDDANDVAG